MAKLDPVLPEIIGRPPRGGMRNDRPVRMAQPDFSGVSRSLGNLADAGMELYAGFQKVKRKEEELLFTEQWNAFVTETQKGLQNEIFSLKGEALTGAEERMVTLIKNASSAHSKGFSPEMTRQWEAKVHAYANSHATSVLRYRDQELSRASIQAYKGEIEGYMAAYKTTWDERAMSGMLAAFEKQYRETHKNIIPAEFYEEFERDINDGDGKVKIPGGRELRIVEEIKPGMIDVIDRVTVEKERERLKAMSHEYELQRQNLIDMAHATVVDDLIKRGEIDKLTEYVAYLEERDEADTTGKYNQVSNGAMNAIMTSYADAVKVRDMETSAKSSLDQLKDESAKAAGFPKEDTEFAVLTPAYQSKVLKAVSELSGGTKTDKSKADILMTEYKRRVAAAELALNVRVTTELSRILGLSDEDQLRQMAAMREKENPSMAAKAVIKAYDNHLKALEEANDPKFIARQSALYLRVQQAITNGEKSVTLNGVKYNLRNADGSPDTKQLANFAVAVGLTPKNVRGIQVYAADSFKNEAITYKEVRSALGDVGVKNPELFIARLAPFLVSHIEEARNGKALPPTERKTFVINWVLDYLKERAALQVDGWDDWNDLSDEERLSRYMNYNGVLSADE